MLRAIFNTFKLETQKRPIERLKIIYPYYMNGNMFIEQQKIWISFPDDILKNLHFIIIDDGSPKKPAIDYLIDSKSKLKMDIYRVDTDIFWNLEGALNLGASFCHNEWMFMSDMDHALPLETLISIFNIKASPIEVFMFKRLRAKIGWNKISELESTNPHKGTFLIHWHQYWKVGGRNEDFCGYYSVGWAFRNKLRRYGKIRNLNLYVVGYLSDEIDDSATPVAKGSKEEVRKIRGILRDGKFRRTLPQNPIRFPWHQEYSSYFYNCDKRCDDCDNLKIRVV